MVANETARKRWKPDGRMRFGLFWPYSRTLIPSMEIANRNPDVLDVANHVALAQAAEETGFDFGLVADGYAPASEENSRIGFQDPSTNAVVWAPYIFQATRHLGVVSTIHTAYVHPTVIARLGAHLDFLSGGRWGWNVVNGFRGHEAKLFGLENLEHDAGYDRSDEATTIIKALWRNEPGGLSHRGQYYSVEGKLRRPLPPETPLLVSAASSEKGRRYAARHCNYLFAAPINGEMIRAQMSDLADFSREIGRTQPPEILMLSDVFIRDEPGRAREEYDTLIASQDEQAQKAWASHLANMKTPGRRPDQVMVFAGTAKEVAEQMIELHRESGLQGVLARLPIWQPEEVLRLRDVFALLKKAGVWIPPADREFSW